MALSHPKLHPVPEATGLHNLKNRFATTLVHETPNSEMRDGYCAMTLQTKG
jgi:hypothetical protein